jgi:hypothetical protein
MIHTSLKNMSPIRGNSRVGLMFRHLPLRISYRIIIDDEESGENRGSGELQERQHVPMAGSVLQSAEGMEDLNAGIRARYDAL